MVQEIARELIREHLQSQSTTDHVKDEEEDSSGLGRAAAYFEKLSMSFVGVNEEAIGDEREIEDVDSWLNLLTEEQVTALVQEILKEKARMLLQPDMIAEEPEDALSPPVKPETDSLKPGTFEGMPEPQGKDDKETDTQDFLSTHLQLVAEKEVQACEAEMELGRVVLPEPDNRTSQQSSSEAKDVCRVPPTRTNLAKAILLTSSDTQAGESSIAPRIVVPPTSISILQQLRAERKRSCRVLPAKAESPPVTKLRTSGDKRPAQRTQAQGVDHSVEVKSVDASSEGSANFSARTNDELHKMGQSASGDALPKLIEKKLFTDTAFHQGTNFNLPSRSSPSASFSDLSSSGDSYRSLFSDFAVSANKSLQVSSTRRRRQKKRWVDAGASVSSSCRSSLASEDLSEGEIERRASLDLSDGELVGKERKRVAVQKNAINRFFRESVAGDDVDSSEELNDTKSSIESGELLPIVSVSFTFAVANHATY